MRIDLILKQLLLGSAICVLIAVQSKAMPGVSAADVLSNVQHWVSLDGPTAECSQPGSCQGKSAPSQACFSAYDRLYPPEKTDLDFRVFVSYWDTQPEAAEGSAKKAPKQDFVIDHLVKEMFSDILRTSCYPGLFACGFAREKQSDDTREIEHLTKKTLGPDGKNRTIHLTIESASVSDSDYDNHHRYQDDQRAQSKKAADDFFNSIGKAEVILYVGHARWGTGPGFKAVPAKLSLSWLDQGIFKPSRRRLENALKHAEEKPSVLGYFACTSEKYYGKYLEKDAPETGLAMTEVPTSTGEAQTDTLGTLNALLGLQCEADFKKILEFRESSPEAEILDFFKP